MGRRAVEKVQNAWYSSGTFIKIDLDKKASTHKEEKLLYKLANTCTAMIREKQGVVGDVARLIGGSLVAPPIDPVHIQRYFGGLKGLGAVDELTSWS